MEEGLLIRIPRWSLLVRQESLELVSAHFKTNSKLLLDRCVKWNPKLLVEIFSNRQRYGLDIPDLHEARRILRRIVYSPKSIMAIKDIRVTVRLPCTLSWMLVRPDS